MRQVFFGTMYSFLKMGLCQNRRPNKFGDFRFGFPSKEPGPGVHAAQEKNPRARFKGPDWNVWCPLTSWVTSHLLNEEPTAFVKADWTNDGYESRLNKESPRTCFRKKHVL